MRETSPMAVLSTLIRVRSDAFVASDVADVGVVFANAVLPILNVARVIDVAAISVFWISVFTYCTLNCAQNIKHATTTSVIYRRK